MPRRADFSADSAVSCAKARKPHFPLQRFIAMSKIERCRTRSALSRTSVCVLGNSVLARPVLIITITNMVLISIQPFAFKRIFFLVAALLCLSSAICFADSLFMSLHSTRYGPQLDRRRVLPLSIPKRIVQPPLPVAGQSSDGEFAWESGWILSTSVLNPTSN